MDQKILVAFDDSENAMRAVDFIAKNFKATGHVTLLTIIQDTESLCKMNSPELTPYFQSEQSSFCHLEEKKKELVQDAMERAKSILIEGGFSEKNIESKIQPKDYGIARGIIKESQSGYDILVMGRRGVSGVKEFFLGSVSQKVFNHAKDISIVMVD